MQPDSCNTSDCRNFECKLRLCRSYALAERIALLLEKRTELEAEARLSRESCKACEGHSTATAAGALTSAWRG